MRGEDWFAEDGLGRAVRVGWGRVGGGGADSGQPPPSVVRAENERKMLLRILESLKEPPPPRPAPPQGTAEMPESDEELAKRVAKRLAERRARRLVGLAGLLKGGYFVMCEPGKVSKKLTEMQKKPSNIGKLISRPSDNYSWMEEHPGS